MPVGQLAALGAGVPLRNGMVGVAPDGDGPAVVDGDDDAAADGAEPAEA